MFRSGVGEDVAEDFVGQPFQGWDESGGVVDGGKGDVTDGINSFVLLLFCSDRREGEYADCGGLGRLNVWFGA